MVDALDGRIVGVVPVLPVPVPPRPVGANLHVFEKGVDGVETGYVGSWWGDGVHVMAAWA